MSDPHPSLAAARAHHAAGRTDQALALLRRALDKDPANAAVLEPAVTLLLSRGLTDQAFFLIDRARAARPEDPMLTAFAVRIHALADDDAGVIRIARNALRVWPENPSLLRAMIFPMLRATGVGADELVTVHRSLGAALERANPRKTGPHANSRDHSRPLRVGYVSQDFRNRSAAHFIEPILEHHDRSRFEVFCYHQRMAEDDKTERLKALSAHWTDVDAMDDETLAQRIRDDGIDILVDLCGHGGHNRLAVFCRKPAPVQMTYLGYPATTGLSSIDARIVDELTDPPGAERFATESLVRMPGCFLCYKPPAHAGPVAAAPRARTGRITFGSFNALSKINRHTVSLWAGVLAATAGSRLLIKGESIHEPSAHANIACWLKAARVAPERVELRPRTPTVEAHLAAYADVDIALDTFPYNGTTTTMEALWMGVPVVTIAGTEHRARVGLSLLTNAGLADWIARDDSEFAWIAGLRASDPAALAMLRASLRQRVHGSPLCDGAAFTAHLEAAYRRQWGRWCERGPLHDVSR